MKLEEDSVLNAVELTISDVRAGSIVIDYSLQSYNSDLMLSAISNIDDMIGEIISIGDGFNLLLNSNTLGSDTGTQSDSVSAIKVIIVAVICAVLVAVFVFAILYLCRSKRPNPKSLQHSVANSESICDQQTRMGPGSVAPKKTTDGLTVEVDAYELITEILKQCDVVGWQSYLNAFKKEVDAYELIT